MNINFISLNITLFIAQAPFIHVIPKHYSNIAQNINEAEKSREKWSTWSFLVSSFCSPAKIQVREPE